MATFRDLRKTIREKLDDPRLAVVFFETENSSSHHFANVINLGVQGVLIESDKNFEKDIKPKIMMKNPELNQWDTFFCRVAWAQVTESEKQYKTGLEFLFPVDNGLEPETITQEEITPQDIEFLLHTRLIKMLPQNMLCSLLNCMSRKIITPDTTFISRANHQDCLYIIQKGHCRVQIKDENRSSLSANQKKEGDIIGDMAFFSSESLISDAVAESELIVWELPATRFDSACRLQPGLINFLTNLLTSLFENPVASKEKSIGQYTIKQPIGEGRSGFVYKGHHNLLNIPVAIKMMKHHETLIKDDFNGVKKRLGRISSLNHPNITQVYSFFEQFRTVFIITEYMEDNTLASFFERTLPFSFDNAMFILAQVCSALAHAHDQKIVHKHLTPSNIFVSNQCHVMVSDFGFAAPTIEEGSIEDRNLYYMAPEQFKGGRIDHRSDIYSLGILAYEMLTGRTPFSRKNHHSTEMILNTTERIETNSTSTTDLPEYLEKFISKACSASPNQRYGSVHEIIDSLSNNNSIFKEALDQKKEMKQEVCALLISLKRNQRSDLFRALDEFSRKALNIGIDVTMSGNIQMH